VTFDPARLGEDLARKPDVLRGLVDTLDAELWADARRSRRVLLLGMGSSYFAADVAARRMRARGVTAVAERASVASSWPPDEGLLVVAVSAGGGSAETLAAVERFASSSATVVALTNRAGSPLEAACGRAIAVEAGVEVSGVATLSYTATQVRLLQLEAAMTGENLGLAERLCVAADAVHALSAGASEWLDAAVADLVGPHGTFLLAPAERLGAAEQGALMLRERPRHLAVACETGDWSHVDVYLTKTYDYRCLLFAGSRWDAQAVEWLRQRGSMWWTVGADDPHARRALRYAGDDDEVVALLAEVTVPELVAAALPPR
jgi:fructoselysine-6-P-deglycase FrlB-like protein